MVLAGGFGRPEWIRVLENPITALAGRVLGMLDRDLLGGRRLPCEARRVVGGVIVRERRAAQVRLVEERAMALVVVIALLVLRAIEAAGRGEEPHLVLHQRATDPTAHVHILFYRWRFVEAAAAQFSADVVGLQARTGELAAQRP